MGSSLLLEDVRQRALAAGLAVLVEGHEHTSAAVRVRALHALVGDLVLLLLAVAFHLEELEDAHLHLLVAMDGLLCLLEDLLLLLLALATTKAQDKMQCRLLLDVVVREGAAFLELLSGEDEALLIWWDAFLLLDLALHILDGVVGLNLKGNGLASEGLDEDLHQ